MTRRRFWLRLSAAAISFCLLAGVANTEGPAAKAPDAMDGLYGVPQNYREIIARYILARTDRATIHRAQITTPGVSNARGSDENPNVCASVWLKGAVIEPSFVVGFTFIAGEIDYTFNPDDNNPKVGGAEAAVIRFGPTCDVFSTVPFPEITAPPH